MSTDELMVHSNEQANDSHSISRLKIQQSPVTRPVHDRLVVRRGEHFNISNATEVLLLVEILNAVACERNLVISELGEHREVDELSGGRLSDGETTFLQIEILISLRQKPCKFLLEFGNEETPRKGRAFKDLVNGFMDFIPDREVLRLEIQKRNFHVTPGKN